MCSKSNVWIRPVVITAYFLCVVGFTAVIINSVKDGFQRNDQLILIGGLFVLTAIPVSLWHIAQHMQHFNQPVLQRNIVRILWMVPIYAMNAWLGLILYKESFYLDCMRECYEAYVIYNFMVYLLNYLNLEMDLERSLEQKPSVPHVFPLCCMKPWRMGREFVQHCKHGILQYVVLRPVTTFISIICELCGVYGESNISPKVAYPYMVAINNMSQFTAMYCLVLFYKANRVELRPMRPIPKFLCIKAVIFFSFFQSVLITFLVYYGFISNIFGTTTEAEDDPNKNLSSKLQNFLICFEMFIAAIAHKYSFPHEPFHINIPNYRRMVDGRRWWDMFNMSDVHADITEHIGVVGSSMLRRFLAPANCLMSTPNAAYLEVDYLNPSTSNAAYENYGKSPPQASYRKYGATDEFRSNDGIAIVKKSTKEDSSHFGAAPKTGGTFFSFQGGPSTSSTPSLRQISEQTTSTSGTASTSTRGNTFTGLTAGGEANGAGASGLATMRKSDSTASDWLSTPTDEMIGIDVKGPEEGSLITFPRV